MSLLSALNSPTEENKEVRAVTTGHGELGDTFQSPLTCPQADHNTEVVRVFLHDDGSQDLAAK